MRRSTMGTATVSSRRNSPQLVKSLLVVRMTERNSLGYGGITGQGQIFRSVGRPLNIP